MIYEEKKVQISSSPREDFLQNYSQNLEITSQIGTYNTNVKENL